MKLLHTGDLHLGKNLHETSLLEDQKIMLSHLHGELAKDSYAALLIAGDIYDRTIPSAEAVELFSNFLVSIRRDFPELTICLIPGNHDSAQRLSYADHILEQLNIHIICNPEQTFSPIITAKNGERLALFLLPFLGAGTLKVPEAPKVPGLRENNALELDFTETVIPILLTQADLASEAARRFHIALSKPELQGIPTVLVAHLFTLAGKESESERLFLGSAEQVSPTLFAPFNYVALGHLHRFQKITSRMYYAGSPLAYAFDESGTEKVFLKVDIDCHTEGFPVMVTPIPVNPFRKVIRLSGRFDEFYTGHAFDFHSSDYLEIDLIDENLIANPMNLLRPKFPYLLSLKQGCSQGNAVSSDTAYSRGQEDKRDPVSDFNRFEEMLYGTVDPEKTALFTELLGECTDEA